VEHYNAYRVMHASFIACHEINRYWAWTYKNRLEKATIIASTSFTLLNNHENLKGLLSDIPHGKKPAVAGWQKQQAKTSMPILGRGRTSVVLI